jgi:hypothetical protein
MARLLAVGVLAIAMVVPAPAAARLTLTTPSGHAHPPPWQRWVGAAQRHAWTPDVLVTFTHGTCPDWGVEAWGCAGPSEVWVRVSLRDRAWARWALDHELGHVVDFAQGDARRAQIAALLGWRRWRPEEFADAWAQCANPGAFREDVIRRRWPLCRVLRTAPEIESPAGAPAILSRRWTPVAQMS